MSIEQSAIAKNSIDTEINKNFGKINIERKY